MLADLKPQSKELVYDLVTQAGVDTSDWANYRRPESPASNPRYCYNWSFEGSDRVVVCLWFEEMKHEGEIVFQTLNYRDIARLAGTGMRPRGNVPAAWTTRSSWRKTSACRSA